MALYASRLDTANHVGEFVLHFHECSLATIAKIAHTICIALNIADSQEAYKSIHYFLSTQPHNSYIKFTASYETDKKSFFNKFSRGGFVGFVPAPWHDCLAIGDVETQKQGTHLSIHELRELFKLPVLLESAALPNKVACTPPTQPVTLVCIPTV